MTAAVCYAAPRGNPGAIRGAAAVWSAMGGELSTLASQVSGAQGTVAASWTGAGARAFASASASQASHLRSLAGNASDMAGVLSQAAQCIEHAQEVYRTQMQRIAAAHASHGPSVLAIAGAAGLGVVAVGTSWIPGVDVATGAAAAGDVAEVGAAGAATAAEAAAVAGEVAAATSVIGDAVTAMTSTLEAVAQEIASIASRFASSMPARFAAQGFVQNTGAQVVNGVNPTHWNWNPANWDWTRIGIRTAADGAAGFVPGLLAVKYAAGSAVGTAVDQQVEHGSINPLGVAAQGAIGGGIGLGEEFAWAEGDGALAATAGAQALKAGPRQAAATAAVTYQIARAAGKHGAH